MVLETGQYWELIHPGKEKSYQTQTAYADVNMNQRSMEKCSCGRIPSISTSKSMSSLDGIRLSDVRPKVILKVWRFNDSASTNDLLAYGVTHLPKTSGFHEVHCEMWTPYGDWKFGALSFYMDSTPRLNNLNILSKDL